MDGEVDVNQREWGWRWDGQAVFEFLACEAFCLMEAFSRLAHLAAGPTPRWNSLACILWSAGPQLPMAVLEIRGRSPNKKIREAENLMWCEVVGEDHSTRVK